MLIVYLAGQFMLGVSLKSTTEERLIALAVLLIAPAVLLNRFNISTGEAQFNSRSANQRV